LKECLKLRKLGVITLLLALGLFLPIVLMPFASAAEYDSVCFAGATVDPTWTDYNSGSAPLSLFTVPDVFNLVSATVSFSSLPVPEGVFNYNWIGATSYNHVTGDIAFFQICLVSPPSGNTVGLNWLVESNKENMISGSTNSVFSNLNLHQTYTLTMYYNGTGWQLACNGVRVFYFDWPNLAFAAQFETETWFQNGVVPNIGTSDFTNCQVGTASGYVPLFAIPNEYKVQTVSSTYSSIYPMYNGEKVFSDSSFQTGFDYPNSTQTITQYQGQEPFSSIPYFGLITNFANPVPTPTPTPTPSPIFYDSPTVSPTATSFPTVSPLPTSWPSSAPTLYQKNSNLLIFGLNPVIFLILFASVSISVSFVAVVFFRNKHHHRKHK
jgi:hypothetical protein